MGLFSVALEDFDLTNTGKLRLPGREASVGPEVWAVLDAFVVKCPP